MTWARTVFCCLVLTLVLINNSRAERVDEEETDWREKAEQIAEQKFLAKQDRAETGTADEAWDFVHEISAMGNMRGLNPKQLDDRWKTISYYIVKSARMGNKHAQKALSTVQYNSVHLERAIKYFDENPQSPSYASFLKFEGGPLISGSQFAEALSTYMVNQSCDSAELAKFAGKNGNAIVALFASYPGVVTKYKKTCVVEAMGRRMVFGIDTADNLSCSGESPEFLSCTAIITFKCDAELVEALGGMSGSAIAGESVATDRLACGAIRAASFPVSAQIGKRGGGFAILGVAQ